MGLFWAAGCGGVAIQSEGTGGAGGSAGASGSGGGGRDAGRPDARDSGRDARDATNDYREDLNCPPQPDAPPIRECDPFAPATGCPLGEACYPFVDYPTGPCDREEYGTRCATEGSGRQGDACELGRCSGGFICVVTGQGDQCIELCLREGPRTCPEGLVCQPVDVEGFGGCF
jgi:hypothetical protein